MKNGTLFETIEDNDWLEEWKDMPEYNNVEQKEPEITVTFKFRSQEDFDTFLATIKECLYKGEKPFDGRQCKDVKSTWYPLKEKPNKYTYESEVPSLYNKQRKVATKTDE